MWTANSSSSPGNFSGSLSHKSTPNSSWAYWFKSWVNISRIIPSIYSVLLLTPYGSCEYAFTSYALSAIPLTTISTNFGIIGTGFQSRFKNDKSPFMESSSLYFWIPCSPLAYNLNLWNSAWFTLNLFIDPSLPNHSDSIALATSKPYSLLDFVISLATWLGKLPFNTCSVIFISLFVILLQYLHT